MIDVQKQAAENQAGAMWLSAVEYHDLFIPIHTERRKQIVGIDVIAEPKLVVGVH